MKIVSWNCNGAFRKKYSKILELDADIYVIQECESRSYFDDSLNDITSNYIWKKGAYKKGVLVFAKKEVKLEELAWDFYGMRIFIPIRINDLFTLVAVWATSPSYIEEFYIWHLANYDRINDNCVFIGDFNSNVIWDDGHNTRNHSAVVTSLLQKGLSSAYHSIYGEEQGNESRPTFYLYRKKDKPYHIDHCFMKKENIKSFVVLDLDWLELSDHIPIVLEVNDVKLHEYNEK